MKEPEHIPAQHEVSTSRLETLTDGIFAIAMTLLVFGLSIPDRIRAAGTWRRIPGADTHQGGTA